MRYLTYLLLLVFGALNACKKEPLPELPKSNDPVYFLKGTIDGEEVSFDAGRNGMYMYTRYSYLNNVLQYNADLNNNINYFKISISNARVDIPSSNIDFGSITEIDLGNMDLGELVVLNKATFNNQDDISSVSWVVNGELQTGEEISIKEPGFYNICVTVKFTNGAEKKLCNDLLLGYKKNASFGLRHNLNQNNQLNCFIDLPEADIEVITWKINGNEYATSNTISFILEPKPYNIEATIKLKNGVKRIKRIFIDGAYPKNFIEDFSIQENQIQNHYWDLAGRLSLTYFENKWRPANFEDKILITEIKKNGVNEEKQFIYEVKGIYEGEMINESNLQKVNGSLEFNLAFAIP